MPVAAICVAIIADLVGSGALAAAEDVVRVVGVAELALSQYSDYWTVYNFFASQSQ